MIYCEGERLTVGVGAIDAARPAGTSGVLLILGLEVGQPGLPPGFPGPGR